MVINLRGTHGSGKSTIVRSILDKGKTMSACSERGGPTEAKRPPGYVVFGLPGVAKPVYVVGPYETACGGCDAIMPYDLIWPRVLKFAKLGHVLFEGALVSSSVGNIGRAMAKRNDCVVGFLNTPLEVCLERIRKRREARGDVRPLNPHNTTVKYEAVLRSRPKLEELGLRCVTVSYKQAVSQVLKLLQEATK